MHQYLPNVLTEEDTNTFKKNQINSVLESLNTKYGLTVQETNDIQEKIKTILENEKTSNKKTSNRTNYLADNVLVPQNNILCLDGMHNLSNICQIFITIINDKVNYVDKDFDEQVRDLLQCESDWTLCPSFKNVFDLAMVRHNELLNMNLVKKDLLDYHLFKAISTHEGILYLCSFYGYLFQDSMDIPFIFFFKIVLDYLVYFFNVNYDIYHLVEKQRIFNMVLGLLQNEIYPFYLKLSLYNAMYYVQSILNCGDVASTNCFRSERSYKTTRAVFGNGNNPSQTASSKIMMFSLLCDNIFDDSKKVSNNIRCHTIPESFEITPYHSISFKINREDIINTVKCNLYDEITYYTDSLYSRETFLEMAIEKQIGINNHEINTIASQYLNSHPMNVNILKMSNYYNVINASDDYCKIEIDNMLFTSDNYIIPKRIAFTKSRSGKTIVFYIVGFLSFLVKDSFRYHNFLCIQIPSSSAASYIET